VTLELAARAEHATALIADTGPGIPPELLERIFDAFITTRKRGSGLGLAICARIAGAHRARLRAANSAGGGAVFTVEFPLLTGVPAPVSV
jgi:signal transduction histidine kinase